MCGQAEEKKRKRRRTEKTGRGDRVSPNPRPNPRNSSLCRPCLSEFPYTHCSRLATVTRRQNSSNLSPLSSSLPLAPHPEPSKQGEGRRREGWVGWADAIDRWIGRGDSLSQLGPSDGGGKEGRTLFGCEEEERKALRRRRQRQQRASFAEREPNRTQPKGVRSHLLLLRSLSVPSFRRHGKTFTRKLKWNGGGKGGEGLPFPLPFFSLAV